MSDVPFEHPGPVPSRPEVPEGVIPGPLPPQREHSSRDLPAFAWWAPFVAFVLGAIAAVVVVQIAMVFIEAAGVSIDQADPPAGVVIAGTFLQGAFWVVGSILLAGVGGRRPTAWAFGFRPARFWWSLALAAAAAVAFYLFSFVWTLALGLDEADNLVEKLGAKQSTLKLVAVAMMVCLLAPIVEEFLFRGFFFPALSGVVGWIGGAIISGGIFGAIHYGGTDAGYLVPLAVLGILLALLYRFSGSLLPCMGLHAFNNAIALSVFMEWSWWQAVLALLLAPAIVVGIASLFVREQPPAPALA